MNKTVLKLDHIVKRYRDGDAERTILDHINLMVGAGEFAAIVGPSGCGKSTLLNIAGMMLSPDSGDVVLCGQNVSALPRKNGRQSGKHGSGLFFRTTSFFLI